MTYKEEFITFMVRSGVLTSVHAFATDPERGLFILAFLIIVIGLSFLLFAWRAPTVGLGGNFSLISRESMRSIRSSSTRSTQARSRSAPRTLTPSSVRSCCRACS